MRLNKIAGKVFRALLLSWWIFMLVAYGVVGNAIYLFKAVEAGVAAAQRIGNSLALNEMSAMLDELSA